VTGPVPLDARMVTPDGKTYVAQDEQHAAWLVVEQGAEPMDPLSFPWVRVITLAGEKRIDPKVYLPGSML
jgi:hypothetical protein